MKNYLKMTALSGVIASLLISPAFAEVKVTGSVDKNKDVNITIDVEKTKTVSIDVDFDSELNSAASASAIVNSVIVDNEVTFPGSSDQSGFDDLREFEGQPDNMNISRTADTVGSILTNTGILQFNQDAGNMSNQGNLASAGLVFGDEVSSGAFSEAYAEQTIKRNSSFHQESPEDVTTLLDSDPSNDPAPHLSTNIAGSIIGNVGVIQVNQNAGNMNNQHNALAAAVGDSAVVALSDAGLGQEIANNRLADVNTVKAAVLAGSANSNTGIVSVNQAAGHMNNQATVISVASLSSAVGLGQ